MSYLKIIDWSLISAYSYDMARPSDSDIRIIGKLSDTTDIITTAIVSISFKLRIVNTLHSSYKLGKMSPEFKLYLRNNNFELGDLCLRKK